MPEYLSPGVYVEEVVAPNGVTQGVTLLLETRGRTEIGLLRCLHRDYGIRKYSVLSVCSIPLLLPQCPLIGEEPSEISTNRMPAQR